MFKLIATAFVFLLVSLLGSGSCAQTFSKVYDHFDRELLEEAYNIEETANGYIIFYAGGAADGVSTRLGVRTIDWEGNSLFLHEYGDDSTRMFAGWANSGFEVSDDSYAIGNGFDTVGVSNSSNSKLMLFNSSGELQNSFTYIDSLANGGSGVINADNFYYIYGNSLDTPNELLGGYLMKISEDLELVWKKVYPNEGSENLSFNSCTEAHEGGFIIGGRVTDFDTFGVCEDLAYDSDPIIMRVDSEGNEIWREQFGTCKTECGAHVTRTSDGNYLFSSCLKTDEPVSGELFGFWPYIVKFDSDGEVIWEQTYGDANFESVLTKVQELSDGNIIAGGYRYALSENTAHRWGLLIKLNQQGDSLWYRKYSFADDTQCFFRDVIETSDGGFAACGRTWPSEENSSIDTWVVKTDEYGCIIPGCHIGVEEFTEKYGSFKVGPNPVSQSENLVVFLPDVKDLSGLSFQLRNLSGQVVKSFVPDEGGTSYLLRMDDVVKGMYVLSLLKDGTKVQSEKVVVR
ncbi:T9SS type A sorting domain-containing protein [Halocola ammonii]